MSELLPFAVQPSSGVPIYRQIVEQVEALVVGGALEPGDTLPSVRAVAGELAINPMTVSKAYSLLEAAGVVRRLRGRGMEVCERPIAHERPEESLRPVADELAARARQLGLNQTQVLGVVREAFQQSGPIAASARPPSGDASAEPPPD